jgi:isopentenyl-diphosphate delta-isomerase
MDTNVEWLVLVDDHDNEIGIETRENCHKGKGLRHRAFVVFLFDGKKLLLQRRSMKKLLWPGCWDVSFTSHVYHGETYEQAGFRRAKQELGVGVRMLERVLSFTYLASQGDYSENEFCVLLVGVLNDRAKPNPDEVLELGKMEPRELESDIRRNPENYTPWLKLAFEKYMQHDSGRF